ncbi:MAG: hypothetical protein L0G52_12085 [Brachybacterium sp.]|uniref:hypothetical protein n=1 Tax=Brachybacterium alimentarium TaxID=47845 RepID=UPI00264C1887|nr:hypothetical protein [Brachybacterium sp.]
MKMTGRTSGPRRGASPTAPPLDQTLVEEILEVQRSEERASQRGDEIVHWVKWGAFVSGMAVLAASFVVLLVIVKFSGEPSTPDWALAAILVGGGLLVVAVLAEAASRTPGFLSLPRKWKVLAEKYEVAYPAEANEAYRRRSEAAERARRFETQRARQRARAELARAGRRPGRRR